MLVRALRRVVDVDPGEVPATVLACLYFFFTLASYFVLRPIRDELAVAAGVRNLPYMFAGTLAVTLVANSLYAGLIARLPVRRFIGVTYQFFAVNLVVFYLLTRAGIGGAWTGRVFFAWTSAFSLFVPSVFWSVMADAFRSGQAKRLFGFIGVGGTLGSIAGSAATALLARTLGPVNLLLVSAVLLEIAALVVLAFFAAAPRAAAARRAAEDDAPAGMTSRASETRVLGGTVWSGATHVARSSYLSGIAGFIVLYTFGSTVLYFAQTDIIGASFATREARTEVLARIELAAQVLTVLTQTFLTGRVIRWFGLGATLALMPALSALGFAALGASAWALVPPLATVMLFAVVRRGTNFALANPATEALFTVVSREDKYKAKSFIETFLYRAGDQVAAWSYAGLAALGLGVAGIAWVAVPFSAVSLALGVWLGRRHAVRSGETVPVRGEVGVAVA